MPAAQPSNRLVFVVPHTHWDREWYDPAARFRQRLVETVDRLLDILETNPEFRCFLLDGQAVLADDYLEVRPDRAAQVVAQVRSGRLLVGPWYILADGLLSSDECLVRNLWLGRRRSAAYGGWLPLGYSPDAFGHPATMPTLLAGFGIKHAILWRGYGGEPGQEKDLFRWLAPDGSEVLVHHLPPAGYGSGASLPAEPAGLKARWKETEATLVPRAAEEVLLVLAGADHHAPDPELPAKVAGLRRIAPRAEFRIGSPLDYFAALPRRPRAPRVTGELRFSYRYTWTLQGTHSTRARLKRAIREADRLLVRWAEPQVALAAGPADRRAALRAAWREHLLNHFHDSLCGSVCDAVAAEVAQRAESVSRQARGLLIDSLHDRLGQDRSRARTQRKRWNPALVVVNPSPHPVRRVVEATVTVFQQDVIVGRPGARRAGPPRGRMPGLTAPDGRVAQVQVLEEYDAWERLDSPDHYPDQDRVRVFRVAVDPGDLPPLGTKTLRVGAKTSRRNAQLLPPVHAVDRRLDFAGWLGLESDRDEGDAYTFEPVAGDHPEQGRWAPHRKVWDGPLIAAVSRDFTVGDRACGTVSARVDARSGVVRIAIDGVNLRGNHRLRIRVRSRGASAKGSGPVSAVADMQFGSVTRPVQQYDRKQFPREWPVSTAPLHRYVSVAAAGYTVFVRGPTEYELSSDGSLAITVLRAVGDLSRDTLRARPGHAAWPMATPGAQESGPFRVELGLAMAAVSAESRPDAWQEVERLSEEFHSAPAGLMLRYGIDVPGTTTGPELTGPGLAFLALKSREEGGGVVARCVNLTGERVTGAWIWPAPIKHAWLARLDETPLSELPVSRDRRQVRFMAEPRAPVTMLIEP